ncbi:MAG: hypothetical protein ACYS0D_02615 [Planctomycetota bacterium]|jgi:hypothetical protein
MTRRSWSARILDARGRRVTQLDPVTMHILHRNDVIDADALRAIAEEIGPASSRATLRWFWIFQTLPILCLPLFFIWVFFIKGGRDPVAIVLWSTILVCLVIGIWGFCTSARRKRFHRVRDAMLHHGRCPHCGYSLTGLPADREDGATVCPECGCAWSPGRRSAAPGETGNKSGA